ncbi:MAG: DUF262 domain-containing protein [Alphaproteobacteria bacterium]|nr:DUF262 domain-containing protein [Alphaproteobacteria bacterium]MDA8030113.1 DUF262 domain-containing protein [Alphaproteobacteria bacterium]
MIPHHTKIISLVDGAKQFKIPIYQRTYDWDEDHWSQLWSDVIRAGRSEQDRHFLGTIVYKAEGTTGAGEIQKYLVVDGQQRLTTVILLAVAMIRHAKRDPSGPLSSKIQAVERQLVINDNKDRGERHKLVLTKNDRETLASIIDSRQAPDDASDRIQDAFEYFEGMIEREDDDELVLAGISKLSFIDIALEDMDDPQQIFERTNSTGRKLSPTDLIRNFVFMRMDDEQQRALYEDHWSPMEEILRHRENVWYLDQFVRDYLTAHRGNIPDKDEVYEVFIDHVRDRRIEDIVADMAKMSRLYSHLLFPDTGPEETREVVENIRRLRSDVAYPFMLRVYSGLHGNVLDIGDVQRIFRMVESYLFRRWMCGMTSGPLNKIFATMSHWSLGTGYAEDLANRLADLEGTGAFPSDDKFRSEFKYKQAYKNQRVLKYMLERIENHGYDGTARVVIDDSITIEHIMPRSLSAEWRANLGPDWPNIHKDYLHTVGNLTIVSKRSNPSIGNATFKKKRDGPEGYKKSKFHLNAELSRYEEWTADEIIDRADALSKRAVKIWPYPVERDALTERRRAGSGSLDEYDEEDA